MFATAVVCAISVDANAGSVGGGPITGTLPIKEICPKCGTSDSVISTIADTGEIVFLCKSCNIIFGYN